MLYTEVQEATMNNNNANLLQSHCRTVSLLFNDLILSFDQANFSLSYEQSTTIVDFVNCLESSLEGNYQSRAMTKALSVFYTYWQLEKNKALSVTNSHKQSLFALLALHVTEKEGVQPNELTQRFIKHPSWHDISARLLTLSSTPLNDWQQKMPSKQLHQQFSIDHQVPILLYAPKVTLPFASTDVLNPTIPFELLEKTDLEPELSFFDYAPMSKRFQVIEPRLIDTRIEDPVTTLESLNYVEQEVFRRVPPPEGLFTASGDLTDDAKARGLHIVEVLEPPGQGNKRFTSQDEGDLTVIDIKGEGHTSFDKPFVVINHGSGRSQFGTADADKHGLLHKVGRQLIDNERDARSYMINDGPGSLGTPHLLKTYIHAETGNLVTVLEPSARLQLQNKLTNKKQHYQALPDIQVTGATGEGVQQNTNRLMTRLHWLDHYGLLPKEMVLTGFSRGGAENHYMANEIQRAFPNKIKLHVFGIDPVPGGQAIYDKDLFILPSNVASYTSMVAEGESRGWMKEISQALLQRASAETKVEFHGLPDAHNRLSVLYAPSGVWVGNELVRFLEKHGTLTIEDKIVNDLSLSEGEKYELEKILTEERVNLKKSTIPHKLPEKKPNAITGFFGLFKNRSTVAPSVGVGKGADLSPHPTHLKSLYENHFQHLKDTYKKRITPKVDQLKFRGGSISHQEQYRLLVQNGASIASTDLFAEGTHTCPEKTALLPLGLPTV